MRDRWSEREGEREEENNTMHEYSALRTQGSLRSAAKSQRLDNNKVSWGTERESQQQISRLH